MQYLLVSDQSDLYRYLLINGQILFPIFQLKTRPPIGWHTGSTNQSPWFPIDLNMIWPLIFWWNPSLNLIADWFGLQGVVFSCSIFYQQIYKYIKAKLPRLYLATKYSWCRLSWASFIISTVDDEKLRFIKWCCIVRWNGPKHVLIFQENSPTVNFFAVFFSRQITKKTWILTTFCMISCFVVTIFRKDFSLQLIVTIYCNK